MSLARIFQRPHYRSETTQFIDQLKKSHPELDTKQREGRGLLWDRQLDRELLGEFSAGKVPQKPYVYQTSPTD